MTETISVPLWFVLVFGLLAVWAVLDRLLMPSVRWVLCRGTNRIIGKLNVRLHIEIQPFQRTKRQHEIVPAFHAYVYFRFGYWLARRAARLLCRVRLAYQYSDGNS